MALRDQGLTTVAFDLRGHGRSGGRRAFVRRFDQYLADLDLELAQLPSAEPARPVFLFGHSMGGAIATLYALDRRPRLAGLVLSAPALRRPATVSAGAAGFTRLLSMLAPTAGIFRLEDRDFSRDPAVVSAMAADPLIYHRPAPARTAGELLRAMDRIRARQAEIVCPLLALHGAADRLTAPEGSREIVRAARSTDKEVRIYPGLYHDLLHEPERASIRSEIVAWIGTRLASQ